MDVTLKSRVSIKHAAFAPRCGASLKERIMSVNSKMFDAVVAAVSGATKETQANIFHTWDGGVSKNVLHIVSRSGARAKDIWHFPLDGCQGATLFFKNTTGTAYC